ncbi:hypothetical protein CHISP_2815 [Chitinispirillum alkaliphilum]|nr:hypothetical protein CHISP_2815 [Chitinispirillum alkaliphilum]
MKTKLLIITLTTAFLIVPVNLSAREGSNNRRGQPRCTQTMRKKWNELGITEEQKDKIRELNSTKRPLRGEVMREIASIRENIKVEMLKDSPDREQLSYYSRRLGDIHKEANERRIEHLLELKSILTEEQFNHIVEGDLFNRQPRGRSENQRRPGEKK